MKGDRDIDVLPSKVVGRRREGRASPLAADALLKTAWALRGPAGLAPRGLYRFATFEETQEWIRAETSRRSGLRRSTTSDASVALSKKPAPATS
jgi:hypothetical protein